MFNLARLPRENKREVRSVYNKRAFSEQPHQTLQKMRQVCVLPVHPTTRDKSNQGFGDVVHGALCNLIQAMTKSPMYTRANCGSLN